VIVGTQPKLLVSREQGSGFAFVLMNLSAGATVLLHREEFRTDEAFRVAPVTQTQPILWLGGELWVSASADNTEIRVLPSEPGARATQLNQNGVTR
jgi:hypothetical protein